MDAADRGSHRNRDGGELMPDEATIDVMYSCPVCGLVQVTAKVPVRREGEDVVRWLEATVVPALSSDHDRRSPDCRTQTLSDLMIPLSGCDYIGGPMVQ